MVKQTYSEAQILDAFKVLDVDGKGYIPAADLRHFVTCIGLKLSPQSADQLISDADIDKDGKIDYKAFSKMLMESLLPHAFQFPASNSAQCCIGSRSHSFKLFSNFGMKVTLTEEEILKAFKVFDKEGKGYISKTDLFHIVTSIGMKLSSKSATEMVNEADKDKDGKIDYKSFAKFLVSI